MCGVPLVCPQCSAPSVHVPSARRAFGSACPRPSAPSAQHAPGRCALSYRIKISVRVHIAHAHAHAHPHICVLRTAHPDAERDLARPRGIPAPRPGQARMAMRVYAGQRPAPQCAASNIQAQHPIKFPWGIGRVEARGILGCQGSSFHSTRRTYASRRHPSGRDLYWLWHLQMPGALV